MGCKNAPSTLKGTPGFRGDSPSATKGTNIRAHIPTTDVRTPRARVEMRRSGENHFISMQLICAIFTVLLDSPYNTNFDHRFVHSSHGRCLGAARLRDGAHECHGARAERMDLSTMHAGYHSVNPDSMCQGKHLSCRRNGCGGWSRCNEKCQQFVHGQRVSST